MPVGVGDAAREQTPRPNEVSETHVSKAKRFSDNDLHVACKRGMIDTVRTIIKSGAAIDAPDAEGNSPLKVAAFHGHVSVVSFLIESGASIDLTDSKDRTALMAIHDRKNPSRTRCFC
ncbi:hypothetical protein PC119_g22229 [Phytophthora cactorum]|nr:hypothetical protein PC111_g19874 [Phytophthora cactorum]KAG2976305.1 hypothetical protein PC119_g22229 [Phytophthora cactorum]KAG3007257.1 hypothetical protein PC120_g16926 [Phytophthora cactorum]KAG3067276.1 hypothetical protein PC121_g10617 [Phytophthora cactorum]